jgi:hypothetical protein
VKLFHIVCQLGVKDGAARVRKNRCAAGLRSMRWRNDACEFVDTDDAEKSGHKSIQILEFHFTAFGRPR